MNHATDFARLYAELAFSPPCTLEVFNGRIAGGSRNCIRTTPPRQHATGQLTR